MQHGIAGRAARRRWSVLGSTTLALVIASACAGEEHSPSEPSTSTDPAATAPATSDADVTGSGADTSSGTADPDTTSGGSGLGGMCDLFAQDCGPDLKCMYGCDGPACSPRCRPVQPSAAGIGEACVAAGLEAELPDDCDAQTLCWTGEAEPGEGICEPFCTGSAAMPSCVDPDRVCAQQQVCLTRCDPLLRGCPDGQGCFDVDVGAFVCWNLQEIPVADGEVCGGNTLCSPGSTCVFADVLSACEGARCCTPLCDLDATDAPCAAVDPELACVPYGAPVPGAPSLGVCVRPQG